MAPSLQPALWRLRGVGRIQLLRRTARAAFGVVFRDGVVRRIPFGPLAGMKWHCATGVQFWMPLGLYEQETAAWIQAQLRPGDVFFDVGANFGYFTLLATRSVGDRGRVVAFEPVPRCADAVRKQIELNAITNAEVREVALSSSVGDATFAIDSEIANSHLASVVSFKGRNRALDSIKVATTTLEEFVSSSGLRPDVIKIDVEGAEMMVLDGARGLLEGGRTRLLVSTHDRELKRQCTQMVGRYPYDVADLPGFQHEIVCVPRRTT